VRNGRSVYFEVRLGQLEITGATGGGLTLPAADYETGAYRLSVIAFKNGVRYVRMVGFAVVN
jgi:hypothetical protein